MIGVQREVKFREGVLNYLFDLFALRKEAAGDAPNLATMTIEERFERGFVTGAGRRHERVIGGFFGSVHGGVKSKDTIRYAPPPHAGCPRGTPERSRY